MCEFCQNIDDAVGLKRTKIDFGLLGKGDVELEMNLCDGRREMLVWICIYGANEYANASVKINYCPMCGRKLTEEENKIEVKPVIHAHAIIDWLGNPKCSNCGSSNIDVTELYCQHCGAIFDEPEVRI